MKFRKSPMFNRIHTSSCMVDFPVILDFKGGKITDSQLGAPDHPFQHLTLRRVPSVTVKLSSRLFWQLGKTSSGICLGGEERFVSWTPTKKCYIYIPGTCECRLFWGETGPLQNKVKKTPIKTGVPNQPIWRPSILGGKRILTLTLR